jgi:PhnB protein
MRICRLQDRVQSAPESAALLVRQLRLLTDAWGYPMKRILLNDRHTVIPRIITPDPNGLVSFVKKVFRADGEFHPTRPSEIRIGDSLIMISDGDGLREKATAFLYVYVQNVDETFRRAVKAEAEILEPPTDQVYGDRRAMIKDRWNNLWQIASRKGESL